MDGKEQGGGGGGEIGMSEKRTSNGGEFVISMSREETPRVSKGSVSKDLESLAPRQVGKSSDDGEFPRSPLSMTCPSPETSRFSPSLKKPPKIPGTESLTRRRSFTRSAHSRPKSRFEEESCSLDSAVIEENYRTGSATPLMASPRGSTDEEEEDDEEEEEEEIHRTIKLHEEKKHRRVRAKVVIEWIAFGCILGCLVASLTVEKLKKARIWGLESWKWCVLVMVIFSGMLVSYWFMNLMVFLIEKNFLLMKKVLYFVHGLRKSIQGFIWIALVLLTWILLIKRGLKRSKTATKILNGVTWTLVSLLIGSFLWLLKTLLLKILASNFHVNRFFDRIQDSVFHQYVMQTLSGPPLIEGAQKVRRSASDLSFRSKKKGKGKNEKKVIDMAKVHKMKREKVTAWNMKVLVDAVTNSGLTTISDALDESFNDGGAEITSEMEAKAAAYRIFRNVKNSCHKYIDEEDLLRFMLKEEVDNVFPLFEGHETGRIDRKSLTNWVLKVYKDRKALAHSLNDTKTAVKQLNKLVAVVVIVVTSVVWLLLMGIATTKVLVLFSSQLVLAAFMFGNTCKTIFEGIIFVFVMHPFDVGDRCVIDGNQLLVEEMNILTTVFLKLDQEKVYYPNSVLATKPISNYYRSPNMGDNVQFSIDFATSVQKIASLRDQIKKYLDSTPQHWQPLHSIVVKEIEDVNKLKMALYCNHTMNFQEFGEKNRRRTELVMEIKRIFEELEIKYHLLPQEVHLKQIDQDQRT